MPSGGIRRLRRPGAHRLGRRSTVSMRPSRLEWRILVRKCCGRSSCPPNSLICTPCTGRAGARTGSVDQARCIQMATRGRNRRRTLVGPSRGCDGWRDRSEGSTYGRGLSGSGAAERPGGDSAMREPASSSPAFDFSWCFEKMVALEPGNQECVLSTRNLPPTSLRSRTAGVVGRRPNSNVRAFEGRHTGWKMPRRPSVVILMRIR